MNIGIPEVRDHRHSYWRTQATAVGLRKLGANVRMIDPTNRMHYAGCDWIFLHMTGFTESGVKTIQTAQQMGVRTWMDVDDSIFHVPMSNDVYNLYADKARTIRILASLDLITVSNTPMLELMSNALSDAEKVVNIVVLPNYLWSQNSPPAHKRNDTKVVAWRGGRSHIEDWPDIVEFMPDIEDVVDELHIFGQAPMGYKPGGGCKVYHHRMKDTRFYFESLKQIKPSVVFNYWADIPFNAFKSDVAWQEATMAGAVYMHNEGWYATVRRPCWTYEKPSDLPVAISDAMREISKPSMRDMFEESLVHMDDLKEQREDAETALYAVLKAFL